MCWLLYSILLLLSARIIMTLISLLSISLIPLPVSFFPSFHCLLMVLISLNTCALTIIFIRSSLSFSNYQNPINYISWDSLVSKIYVSRFPHRNSFTHMSFTGFLIQSEFPQAGKSLSFALEVQSFCWFYPSLIYQSRSWESTTYPLSLFLLIVENHEATHP